MSNVQKVAVVTGANKGLGYCTTKQLCRRFDGVVLLTARDSGRGHAAVAELRQEGLHPVFHELDVTSLDSIRRLKSFIKANFGRVDVLVQNAGIACEDTFDGPDPSQVEKTIDTNFTGALEVFKELRPLLKSGARVVNVTSGMGKLEILGPELRVKFADPHLTEDQLVQLINEYLERSMDNDFHKHGWPNSPYGVSKLALIALTKVQARQLERNGLENVLVSSVSPGWVRTDMGGCNAPVSPDQGARSIVEIAFLPKCTPNGQFWRNGKLSSW
eukprot:g1238.t1